MADAKIKELREAVENRYVQMREKVESNFKRRNLTMSFPAVMDKLRFYEIESKIDLLFCYLESKEK